MGCLCPKCLNPLSKKRVSQIMDAVYNPAFVFDISTIGLVASTNTASRPTPSSPFAFSSMSDSVALSSALAKAPDPSINGEFYVVLLTGERLAFQWMDHRNLQTLRIALEKTTNVEPNKQKLIFNGTTLDVRLSIYHDIYRDLKLTEINLSLFFIFYFAYSIYVTVYRFRELWYWPQQLYSAYYLSLFDTTNYPEYYFKTRLELPHLQDGFS